MEYNGKNCQSWKKEELIDMCKKNNLKFNKSMNKTQLCAVLLGETIPVSCPKRKKENMPDVILKLLPISVTGARTGDTLKGIRCVSNTAIMKITKGDVLPYKKDLLILKEDESIWKKFLEKLHSIHFFSNMSTEQREEWLFANATDKNIDISEFKVEIQLIDPGTSDFKKLDNIDTLMSESSINASSVRDLFPRKTGSKAARQTLIFLPGFWSISVTFQQSNTYQGLVFNLNTQQITNKAKAKQDETIYTFDDFAIQTKIGKSYLNEENKESFIKNYFPKFQDYDNLEKILSRLTVGGYKSLIQKIIRFRPLFVTYDTLKFHSEHVLALAIINLIINPGTFIPDIQRYVRDYS